MTKFKNIVGKQVGITKNISKIHVDFQEITGNMKIYFQKSPLVLKFSQMTICEGLWCLWGDNSTCSLILFLYWPKISAHLQKSSENVCKQ